MFPVIDNKKKLSDLEHEVLDFWRENKVFEKSIENRKDSKLYSFYDGPPFITGVPHFGTLLPSVAKDCVPRYWTMKGYQVERRWGWDCHGLPAENMVEKKLGIKSKKEIEERIGIEKFNQTCFETVSKIAAEWEDIIRRIGRWVKFKGAYKTMDRSYMESVWWAFKQMCDKGLVYEDVRISLYCPHCATPLSNFEIAMDDSYEIDTDPSVYVKLKIKNEENTYFLVWTTTPWTLPANVALAVGENIKYKKIKNSETGEVYILAEDAAKRFMETQAADTQNFVYLQDKFKGSDLVNLEYEPIFPHNIQGEYKVILADFVSAEDGTGIVHIAPAFGEDDFNARKQKNLPIILNIDEEGKFTEGEWVGMNVWDANAKIVTWLKENGFLFKKENIKHSYPHCYRCHAKMIYKAQPAWFVAVAKIREKLLEKNENINWFPEYLKEGRFRKGIESAPDWNISRDRYWGTPMPVWKCERNSESQNSKLETDCKNVKIIGSYDELEKLSGIKLDDYHRPKIDEVEIKCEKCGRTMKRIPQIFDCWLESGSMPFAQFHYPFENKEKFEKSFPADFICEYVPQTRAWFYLLHVVGVSIFGSEAFKNVIVTGTIAGNDGRKMSKSLGNYTNPSILIERYTADALRFYFLSSPLMSAQDVSLQDKDIDEIYRGMLMRFWNSFTFFNMYANVDGWESNKVESRKSKVESFLDKWILSELNVLVRDVNKAMENYELNKAARLFPEFIDDLSNWYIRRSRRRFWKSEDDADKNSAYQTLYTVLVELSKVMAPFTPFISETIFRNLTPDCADVVGNNDKNNDNVVSVHLQDFPAADESLIDEKLNNQMGKVRKIVELGLAARAKAKIKVRRPLSNLTIEGVEELPEELTELIKDEVNVKEARIKKQESRENPESLSRRAKADRIPNPENAVSLEDNGIKIILDTAITEELQVEGIAREIVRSIQQARKDAGLDVSDRIEVAWSSDDSLIQKAFADFRDYITREVLAEKMENLPLLERGVRGDGGIEMKVDGREWKLRIAKK